VVGAPCSEARLTRSAGPKLLGKVKLASTHDISIGRRRIS
jgi:hypothetical protein